MGVSCNTNKKNSNGGKSIKSGDRIIKCNITLGNENFIYNYSSQTNIKEIKQSIKRQILKANSDTKLIKLYYQGKELKSDISLLGTIVEGDDANLVMVCITVTEEMMNDHKKFNEILINNLASFCSVHRDQKALLVCINCSESLCQQCENDHNSHEIINKTNLIKYEEELRENFSTLNSKFKELKIDMNYEDFYKDFKQSINKQCEDMVEIVDQIKKKQLKVMNNFKMKFDTLFPSLLDYKDNLNDLIQEISESQRETIIRNESAFINFYHKYIQTLSIKERSAENLNLLQLKLNKYKFIFEEFKQRTDEILTFVNDHYEKFMDYEYHEDSIILNMNEVSIKKRGSGIFKGTDILSQRDKLNNSKISNTNKNNNEDSQNILRNFNSNNGEKKINLYNLITSPKKGRSIVDNFEQLARTKGSKNEMAKTISRNDVNFGSSIIKDNSNANIFQLINNGAFNSTENLKYILTIEVSTKNIFKFDIDTKLITKIEVDLLPSPIKRFEAYHSTLNYRNAFYISGGYSVNSKMFVEFSPESNKFKNLKSMPNGHSYHTMLPMKNNIFVISGFNSKKVDSYTIDTDSWISLPDLNTQRCWPSCLIVKDRFIYVFGGIKEIDKKGSEVFERFDFREPSSKWENLELDCSVDFPFHFGVLNHTANQFIFVGGKLTKSDNNIDKCYDFNPDQNTVNILDTYIIPYKDEFEGRYFVPFKYCDDNNFFGQFSAIFPNRFYLFNKEKSKFELIEYQEK